MSEPLQFQSGVTGLLDIGYRFQTTDGSWVGSRITSGITESAALDGTYCAAAATIPGTAKSVHWNSSGTASVYGNEIFDTVGSATVGVALSTAHGSGLWGSSSGGSGAFAITVTVKDGSGNLLQNANVRVTEGVNSYILLTNASGNATFSLDAATYTVSITKSGYSFTPLTRTVTGNQTGTLINDLVMTVIVITPPTDPTLCRLYGFFLYPSGAVAVGIRVEATLVVNAPASTGSIIIEKTVFVDTDDTGYAQLDVIRTDEYTPTATYTITVNKCGLRLQGISLTSSTQDINALL